MLLDPVFSHDAVIALHELYDCHPDILMAYRTLGFDPKFNKVHLPLFCLCVDILSNAGVPTAARSVLNVVRESLQRQFVHFNHHVQFIRIDTLIKYINDILLGRVSRTFLQNQYVMVQN